MALDLNATCPGEFYQTTIPILTAKSFFASLAICIAAAFAIWAALLLVAYNQDRRRTHETPTKPKSPTDLYWESWAQTMIRMRKTVEMAAHIPNLYAPQRGREVGAKDHFLFMLRNMNILRADGHFSVPLSLEERFFPIWEDMDWDCTGPLNGLVECEHSAYDGAYDEGTPYDSPPAY